MSAQTRGETTRCALTLPQAMADGKSLGSRSQTWWPAPWMASVDAVCQAQVGKTRMGITTNVRSLRRKLPLRISKAGQPVVITTERSRGHTRARRMLQSDQPSTRMMTPLV